MELPLDQIVQWGFMGFVTIYLLRDRTQTTEKMVKALNNNTVALEGLKTVVEKCKKD